MNVELDDKNHFAILTPEGRLSEADFDSASKIIDSQIKCNGELKGLVIYTKSFPGWESFGSFVKHLKFVNDHHKQISKVAFVSESIITELIEKVASHFVSAEIKSFNYGDLNIAKDWIIE